MTYYSIYDAKAEVFLTPVLFHNDQEAARWFKATVQQKDAIFNGNEEDFTLYKVAEFDERHGNIVSSKKELINGRQFRKDENGN